MKFLTNNPAYVIALLTITILIQATSIALGHYKEIRLTMENEFLSETVAFNDATIKNLAQERTVLISKLRKTSKECEKFIRTERTVDAIITSLIEIKPQITEEYALRFALAIKNASTRFNIEPQTLIAIAWHENSFREQGESHAGAKGAMQIMPMWVNDSKFVEATGITKVSDLDNLEKNIMGGAYIYHHYHSYWNQSNSIAPKTAHHLALLSYNRGLTRVINDVRRGKNPENGYASAVFSKRKRVISVF